MEPLATWMTARSATDQTLVLSYFDLITNNSDADLLATPDDNFVHYNKGLLYLHKAQALLSPQMKGATSTTVKEMLQKAQRMTPPERIRRQIIIDIIQTQAHFSTGEYEEATKGAIDALEKSKQICSRLNRDHIEKLYRQLLETSYKGMPLLVRLGVLLQTW
jgi:hypothetical protein